MLKVVFALVLCCVSAYRTSLFFFLRTKMMDTLIEMKYRFKDGMKLTKRRTLVTVTPIKVEIQLHKGIFTLMKQTR